MSDDLNPASPEAESNTRVPSPAVADTAVSSPADGDSANPDGASQENVEQPESEDEKRKRRTVSERISEITAQRRQAEARAQAAEKRAMAYEQELRRISNVRMDEMPYDQAESLRIQQAIKTEKLHDHIQEAESQSQAAFQSVREMFLAKVAATLDRMPGLMEEFDRVPVTRHSAEIIAESDKAAEIAYYLAKNPREAAEISRLPSHQQGVRLARIEAKVSSAPTVRKVSTAPQPVATLQGSRPASGGKSLDEMSFEEYREARNKQMRGGKR